ncbi:capsid assembly scaffolding protein Gp46 family protein [Streptococcus suis]|uniref:capsid assembly scaffolding protein Gp46 family protein n=1 Tax=Streptococcus suis TaxID=1307 RepID=UPI001478B552
MADDIKDTVVETENETVDTSETAETTEKTFTQEEVNALIEKRLAKQEKSFNKRIQEKLDEAEKLRQMNAEQKAEYEAQKQADYIAELEAKINRSGLEKEASKMLSESGLVADDKILGFVVKDTAEATQEAVDSFSALVNDLADKKVGEMLKGKTPKKVEQSTAGGITKEQFNRMGYKDRNELLQNDPELYAKLKG